MLELQKREGGNNMLTFAFEVGKWECVWLPGIGGRKRWGDGNGKGHGISRDRLDWCWRCCPRTSIRGRE